MFHASLVENPTNCRFEGQDDDEDILLLVRAHPITNLPWILLSILVLILPYLIPRFTPLIGVNLSLVPERFILAFLIIDYLLVLIIVFEGFLGWYFNVYLVTTKRVVDVNFSSILSKSVDLASLRDIQEADTQMTGLWSLIFNYGNIIIQTAAAKVIMDFKNVPSPNQIADKIMDLAESF